MSFDTVPQKRPKLVDESKQVAAQILEQMRPHLEEMTANIAAITDERDDYLEVLKWVSNHPWATDDIRRKVRAALASQETSNG